MDCTQWKMRGSKKDFDKTVATFLFIYVNIWSSTPANGVSKTTQCHSMTWHNSMIRLPFQEPYPILWEFSWKISCYHKWPLTDLWLLDLIIKVFKKVKLDKQQKMLLSLRFILRHTVLKYMIVVVYALEQPTTWSLPIVLHIGVLLFLK